MQSYQLGLLKTKQQEKFEAIKKALEEKPLAFKKKLQDMDQFVGRLVAQ